MASIITQNIGAAAASMSQPAQPIATAKDQTARPITQEQVQRASQEAARSLSQNLKNNGNSRSLQTPPRVESPFQGQRDKAIKKDEDRDTPESETPQAPERKSRAVA